jgi:hypothetical protein
MIVSGSRNFMLFVDFRKHEGFYRSIIYQKVLKSPFRISQKKPN